MTQRLHAPNELGLYVLIHSVSHAPNSLIMSSLRNPCGNQALGDTGTYWGNIRVTRVFYGDNGKENGNLYHGLYKGLGQRNTAIGYEQVNENAAGM